MYIKLLGSHIDFSKYSVGFIEDDGSEDVIPTPPNPDVPDVPEVEEPEVVPEEYTSFVNTYARSTMDESQKSAASTFLHNLTKSGLMGKIRQLYLPCMMTDWEHCFLNVARFFNEGREEYPAVDLVSNATLGRCFEVCDYGIYKTSSEIKWGDCIAQNWYDEDVKFNNCHLLMFKPAQMDATTNTHSGGINIRSRTGATTAFNFSIGGSASTTLRQRGGWNSGTVTIDGVGVPIKDTLFTFPVGWGNGTHDPYCTGLSIHNNKLVTPSSNYQEFGYNNRNLVNEINEMELTGQYTLPETSLTGIYSWGGYLGACISMQQSLATSIFSVGLGLSKDEIESYMTYANEFIRGMRIYNDNWNPDSIQN